MNWRDFELSSLKISAIEFAIVCFAASGIPLGPNTKNETPKSYGIPNSRSVGTSGDIVSLVASADARFTKSPDSTPLTWMPATKPTSTSFAMRPFNTPFPPLTLTWLN